MTDAIRFPWNKVLAATAQKDSSTPDKGKILDFVEKNFNEWFKSRPLTRTTGVDLDPDFNKAAGSVLHPLFKNAGNEMKIDGLAMAYAIKTDAKTTELVLSGIRDQLRAYCHAHSEQFHITRGGLATVYRIADASGKPTDVKIKETATLGSNNGKALERYTKAMAEYGTKAQFTAAKAALGLNAITPEQFKNWMAKDE